MKSETLEDGYLDFTKIAEQWEEVPDLFYQTGETQKIEYIDKAAEKLIYVLAPEKAALEKWKQASR